MVEPLFRFDGALQPDSTVLLDGPEGHHAAAVRRMRSGEAIALTNGKGLRARGLVDQVLPKQLTVRIASVVSEFETNPRFTLIQAIAKGDRDELAIQAATELGVSKIIPWQSERSVSRWDGKELKNRDRWQSIVDEAAKQSLRVNFPVVQEVIDTSGLVKQLSAYGEDQMCLVLDPTASVAIADADLIAKMQKANAVSVLVGPEGGITDSELAKFEQSGVIRVHLGTGILRTSTAGMASLSYLSGALGKWQ